MAPSRIGSDNPLGDSLGDHGMNALKSGLLGGGIGAGYHLLKRHLLNTPQQNAEESPNTALRRILLPAVGMAGVNMAERSVFPDYVNRAAHGDTPQLVPS